MAQWPNAACNVGQEPDERAQHCRDDGVMHCQIKHGGITMLPLAGEFAARPRWIMPSELWSCMGFPSTAEAQAACKADCWFSRQKIAPAKRSPHSQRSQIGNSIHVNLIGASVATTVLALPTLGERMAPSQRGCASSAVSSGSSSSSTAAAFLSLAEAVRARGQKRKSL